MPQTTPTLGEVARLAGVSIGTASKVMNRRPGVSREVRARVRNAAYVLGYVGREERHARRRRIMLMFDGLSSLYSSDLLAGAIQEGHIREADILVITQGTLLGHGGTEEVDEWFDPAAHDVDGFVVVTSLLMPGTASGLARRGVPIVVVDPVNTVDTEVARVGATNVRGGFDATRHMLELGHRDIAYVGGPLLSTATSQRFEGYRTALERHGVAFRQDLVRIADFTVEGGRTAALDLLSAPDGPTAFFAGSDLTALGVMDGAKSLGKAVPEDVSVVGFDDIESARHGFPKLTTVRQPITEMGATAVRLVTELLDDPGNVGLVVELPTELVVRESSGPPPG